MPELKIPGGGHLLIDSALSDTASVGDKAELSSLRSSSPKSSSSYPDDVGSVVSSDGYSSADEQCAAAALLELEEEGISGLDEDFEASLTLFSEEDRRAEELTRQGADMRHVLCTSWKLQPKMAVGMRLRKSTTNCGGGAGRQQMLKDAAAAQKNAIFQVEYERYASGYRNNSSRSNRSTTTASTIRRPPPGFEQRRPASGLDFPPLSLLNEPATTSVPKTPSGITPILVSYADGSNTLSLAAEPLVLHDLTVSCVADTCHIFLAQVKNPTYAGLEPLEAAMAEAYSAGGDAALLVGPPLLRPIATGSLLAVFSDEKWYRCQVVSFNEAADTCDIKFVDHGGYTTVGVAELRPLRSDFVRLPFQAVEVYVAAIRAADDEVMIDITSDLLFRQAGVSLQLLGYARDGVPVVQIYFYQGDYIHLLSQEILDDCYQTYLRAHPGHVAVAPLCAYEQEEEEEELQYCCSEEDNNTADESGFGTGGSNSDTDETETETEQQLDWNQQVESWNEADSTLAVNRNDICTESADSLAVAEDETSTEEYAVCDGAAACVPVYSPAVYMPLEPMPPGVFYPLEQPACVPVCPVLYYVADPSGAFYPVVAAPASVVYAVTQQPAYLPVGENNEEEYYPEEHYHEEQQQQEEEYDVAADAEVYHHHEDEVEESENVEHDSDEAAAVDHMAELLSKPFEDWSQEDYELYYQYEQQHH